MLPRHSFFLAIHRQVDRSKQGKWVQAMHVGRWAKLAVGVLLLCFVGSACRPVARQEPMLQPHTIMSNRNDVGVEQALFLTTTAVDKIEALVAADPQLEEKMRAIMVSRGEKNPKVDRWRDFFTIPQKLMLWNKTVGSGELAAESEEVVRAFLAKHDLADTHISINEYNPKLIWKRTYANKETSFLSKITLGNLNALVYTVTFGRLTGATGDGYDTMSDTLIFYSDNLDVALREAGLAVDRHEKNEKGISTDLYALGRYIFPIALVQEAMAAGKVFDFVEELGSSEGVEDAYALIIPSFGMYLAATILLLNKWISNAQGKEDWVTRAAEAIGKSEKVNNLPPQTKKWATHPRLLKWGIIIPVIVGANIVGRAIGALKARVKEPQEGEK